MFKASYILTLFLVSLAVCSVVATSLPGQIHVAMAGPSAMRVMWFTNETTSASICNFGVNTIEEASATGSAETYLENYGSHHVVLLENLKRGTTYKYAVGDGQTMSETFAFSTMPDEDYSGDITMAVFGDMGYMDSVSRPMGILGSKTMSANWSATFSRETLERWKDNKEIDLVWHVGDVGYADDAVFHTAKTLVQFEYEGAYNGYMDWMQNVTATLPYHVLPGNSCQNLYCKNGLIFLFDTIKIQTAP